MQTFSSVAKFRTHFTTIIGLFIIFNFPVHSETSEHIFPLQDKHVHSSSIVECPNGDLLVCWFEGSGERKANDVRIRGARLQVGSESWSPVFEMADTYNLPDCNPVLFIDAQDKLWLFWIAVQASAWEHSVLKYRTSLDYQGDGPPQWNWQDDILLQPGENFARILEEGLRTIGPRSPLWSDYAPKYISMICEAAADAGKRQTGWMTRCHPLILPGGRFLLPLYSDGFNVGLVAISDDGGETWEASQPIVGLGNVQPGLVRKKDGTLMAYMRDNGDAPQRVQVSHSTDDGESWSYSQDMDILNPGSSVQVLSLKEGIWLLVGNDTEKGRHQLVVMISHDEGESWETFTYLEQTHPGEGSFSYPSLIQSSDGAVHITYSYSLGSLGKTIHHHCFSPQEVASMSR